MFVVDIVALRLAITRPIIMDYANSSAALFKDTKNNTCCFTGPGYETQTASGLIRNELDASQQPRKMRIMRL